MGNRNGSALHRTSDDEDKHLFELRGDPTLASTILSIKHNDPEVKRVSVAFVDDWDARAWTRLGQVLGDASHVEELRIMRTTVNVAGLCIGLQSNQSIQTLKLLEIDLGDKQMSSFVPFLSHNSRLKQLNLPNCNLGSSAIDLLSDALLQRSEDTLETLDLGDNHINDLDLEKLAPALRRNRNTMRCLYLQNNQIGSRGCDSLANLLGRQKCNLIFLHLHGNSINNKAADVLAKSLAKNTHLRRLDLSKNDGITSEGWSTMLKLVCNTSSIKGILESNHYLDSLGMVGRQDAETLHRALGFDDSNLLCTSLTRNATGKKMHVVRRKILWSHARGDLNIGNSSIVSGAMPRIIALIGHYSNESNDYLIRYHKPSLPKERVDIVRLDAIYRIVQTRPDLCIRNKADAPDKKRTSIFNRGHYCLCRMSAIRNQR